MLSDTFVVCGAHYNTNLQLMQTPNEIGHCHNVPRHYDPPLDMYGAISAIRFFMCVKAGII